MSKWFEHNDFKPNPILIVHQNLLTIILQKTEKLWFKIT